MELNLCSCNVYNYKFCYLGYEVVPNYFAQALKKLPMLYDEDYVATGMPDISDECERCPSLPYCKYPKLVMP